MRVSLSKDFVDANKAFFVVEPYEFDLDKNRYYDSHEVNLRRFTMPQVKGLLARAEGSTAKGCKNLARDLMVWIRANETADGPAKTRARTVKQACELLIEYIRRTPRKHVYMREQRGIDGVTVCYYAILSRCTARIPYGPPPAQDQARIWAILTDANGIDLDWAVIEEIVKAQPKLSGRDIKNLLKLAMMVAHSRGVPITPALVSEVKAYKPTFDGALQNVTAPTD